MSWTIPCKTLGKTQEETPQPAYLGLDCGIYRFAGRLRKNSQGQFVLILRENTSESTEFLLLGGDPYERLKYVDARVALEGYLPKKTLNNPMRAIFFQRFIPDEPLTEGYRLVKAAKCNQLSPSKVSSK